MEDFNLRVRGKSPKRSDNTVSGKTQKELQRCNGVRTSLNILNNNFRCGFFSGYTHVGIACRVSRYVKSHHYRHRREVGHRASTRTRAHTHEHTYTHTHVRSLFLSRRILYFASSPERLNDSRNVLLRRSRPPAIFARTCRFFSF